MESCLASAQLKRCSCADAKFSGYLDKICSEEDEREYIRSRRKREAACRMSYIFMLATKQLSE